VEPYANPRHYAGFAAALVAVVDAASAYVLRDSLFMISYLAPTSALAALLAICFWVAPNNIAFAFEQQPTWRTALWIGGFISLLGLVVAIPRIFDAP
jgi:hypothetical protein